MTEQMVSREQQGEQEKLADLIRQLDVALYIAAIDPKQASASETIQRYERLLASVTDTIQKFPLLQDSALNEQALTAYRQTEELLQLLLKSFEERSDARELLDFSQALTKLARGIGPDTIFLPAAEIIREHSFVQLNAEEVTLESLPDYAERVSTTRRVFVQEELNVRAIEILNQIQDLLREQRLITAIYSNNRLGRTASSVLRLEESGGYALVPSKPLSPESALGVISYSELLAYLTDVVNDEQMAAASPFATQFVKAARDLQSVLRRASEFTPIETTTALRATEEVDLEGVLPGDRPEIKNRRLLLLEYAQDKRRVLITLRFLSLFSTGVPDSSVVRDVLRELRTIYPNDRKTLNELQNVFGARLVDSFKQQQSQKLLNYQPGLRRTIINEARDLRGSSFISASEDERINETLGLAITRQRQYFIDKANELLSLPTPATTEMAGELFISFEVFSFDDLDFRSNLQNKTNESLRNRLRATIEYSFRIRDTDSVIQSIQALPETDTADKEFRSQLFTSYAKFLSQRQILEPSYAEQVERVKMLAVESKKTVDEIMDVGRNHKGAALIRGNFRRRLAPLLHTLEGNPARAAKIAEGLTPTSRKRHTLNRAQMREQRALTKRENAWFASTELTSFNAPYLAALVKTDRALALQHLEYLFERISRETQKKLGEVQYFPAVLVGIGPNGMRSLAEMRRLTPQLVEGTLIIDGARNPGGPFAAPEGPAFLLNSQSPRQPNVRRLLDRPQDDAPPSITDYGSPLEALPGQRNIIDGPNPLRSQSINIVDPALTMDGDVATGIYPTNEDMELVIQIATAMTVQHLSLQTNLVGVEENYTRLPGDKLLTLQITDLLGRQRIARVTTDVLIMSTGLGEPNFGFDPQGKRAQRVLAESALQTESVPKVTTTLQAFRGLSGRYEAEPTSGLGSIVGIVGKGNSFDTLAEQLVGRFTPDNAQYQAAAIRRKLRKIYVIAPNPPRTAREYLAQQRSRYIGLADFIDRGEGRDQNERLITFIDARVSDFDFAKNQNSTPTVDRTLVVYDQSNSEITDQYGKPIEFDNLIFASGFTSKSDSLFRQFARQRGRGGAGRVPLTLSTAPDLQVGETLPYDSNTIFIGTAASFASNPRLRYKKLADIARTSPYAVDALLRVGAENFVALGVVGRDVTAATGDFLWQRRPAIEEFLQTFHAQKANSNTPVATDDVPAREAVARTRLSRNLDNDQLQLFASAVLSTELEGELLRTSDGSQLLNRDYVFEFQPRSYLPPDQQTLTGFLNLLRRTMAGTLSGQLPGTPLVYSLVGSYENTLALRNRVIGNPARITRATNVITSNKIEDEQPPTVVLNALTTPAFLKAVEQIVSLSSSQKVRLRVSIRQGRILPQRTQMAVVSEF